MAVSVLVNAWLGDHILIRAWHAAESHGHRLADRRGETGVGRTTLRFAAAALPVTFASVGIYRVLYVLSAFSAGPLWLSADPPMRDQPCKLGLL
jgi:hypothetical protein